MSPVTIIILRLVAPLLILRFPLIGVAICTYLDWVDFSIIGGWANYQEVDKILDLYYLAFCLAVVFQWKDRLAKRLAVGLFVFRAIGVVVLTVFQQEWIAFAFPNVFEPFFIFYMLYVRLTGSTLMLKARSRLLLIIPTLLGLKLYHEGILHLVLPLPVVTASLIDALRWTQPIMCLIAVLPAVGVLAWLVVQDRKPGSFGQGRWLK